MAWFALVIAALAVAHFAIAYPQFLSFLKRGGLVILALTAAAAAFAHYTVRQDEQRRQVALRLVDPSQVAVSDAGLTLDGWQVTSGSGRITAMITNNSPHRIVGLKLRARVQYCPAAGPCRIVADKVVSGYIDIPGGQSRAFEASDYFAGLPQMRSGSWTWTASIAEIEAERG
jgi:hypothetical protein